MAKPMQLGEGCAGCGALAFQHPMVVVMHDDIAGGMRAFPVCHHCWTDPMHRQMPLKGHFFPRAMGGLAVAMAGSSNIGG